MMVVDDGRTHHDPAAEAAARAFEAAVDALFDAGRTYEWAEGDRGRGLVLTTEQAAADERADAARAALIAAHDAAVADADAAGYARAMTEVRASEKIDTSTWTEADLPALVNGGPPRDALDDGR